MSAVAEILIKARNQASQALNAAGNDMQAFADKTKDSAGAIDSATKVMSKALRGDLVGAVKDAVRFWKSLGTAFAANPFGAAIAAATVLVGVITKLVGKYREAKEAKEAFESQQAEGAAKFEAKMEEIRNGTPAERRKSEISKLVDESNAEELERRMKEHQQRQEAAQKAARDYENERQNPRFRDKQVWRSDAFSPEGGYFVTEKERVRTAEESANLRDQAAEKAAKEKKIVEEYAAALKKVREADAAAAKKAAEDEQAAIEANGKKIREKALAELRGAAEVEEALLKQRKTTQDTLDKMEEAAEERVASAEKALEAEKEALKVAQMKTAVERANEGVQGAQENLRTAREAWEKRGLSGFWDRHDAQKAAAKEAADERQLQRQLGRWERGYRDRPAVAAHELQGARDIAAAAQEDAVAQANALKGAEAKAVADKLGALQEVADTAKKQLDELKNLKNALLGE